MPELPSNAKYLHHNNECFDWGTFGWAIHQEDVQVADYKYFIFLNSSVRGPFLPPYLQVRLALLEVYSIVRNRTIFACSRPSQTKVVFPVPGSGL